MRYFVILCAITFSLSSCANMKKSDWIKLGIASVATGIALSTAHHVEKDCPGNQFCPENPYDKGLVPLPRVVVTAP